MFGGKGLKGPIDKLYALLFDRKLPRWSELAVRGPPARVGHSMCHLSHLNKILILGGRAHAEDPHDMWGLSLKGMQWERMRCGGDNPFPRYGHCAGVHNEQVMMMGGLQESVFPRNDLYVLYSGRYFAKKGGDEREEYKKAYYHATGWVLSW